MKHENFGFYYNHIASSRIKALSKIKHLYLVILAGGEGTRLFPYSNPERPKQLCHIDGGDRNKDTFLKRTITNFVESGFDRNHIIVVTSNERQMSITRHQAANPGGVPVKNVWEIPADYGYVGTMVEATKRIAELDSEAIVFSTPSDNYLTPNHQFVGALLEAANHAKEGNICTVGTTGRDTGIMAWRATKLLNNVPDDVTNLSCHQLTDTFDDHRKIAIGDFDWQDCDTFRRLYTALDKSPLNQNVILGEGNYVLDNSCHRSLFYVDKGITLNACDVVNSAVIFTMIKDQPVLAIIKLGEDEKVRELAEEFAAYGKLRIDEPSLNARNNQILYSNMRDKSSVGFVNVDNFVVHIFRRSDNGTIEAEVFKQE